MQSTNAFKNRRVSRIRPVLSAWRLLPCLALLGSLGVPGKATADPTLLTASALGGIDDLQNPGAPTEANAGPVRLARFSTLTGDVTWRDSADGSWSQASPNMPLRQGAQIWVADGGRAEVQFDDGSRVRLDSNSLITLQTLYSDADGEFTEITLNDGRAYLRLNNKYSLYQVNTPQASLKANGPAQIRVGSGQGAQFGVRSGAANVEGAGGKVTLNAGDYLDVMDANTPYEVVGLPRPDSWDSWNLNRDEALDNAGRTSSRYLPSNVALVADDLESYGSWHNDSRYGWVWSPRNVDQDWRPYRAGHWTWVEPFGWTWVSTENWGWAPYHYGAWVHQPYGWAWAPGPSTQYWSPGVVSFTENAGVVAWCPLAPAEVRYPSQLTLGFRSGNWSQFFSIGGAAVYYPISERYCEPRPFQNVYVNRVTNVTNITRVTNVTNINNINVNNITVNRNTYQTSARFVPSNARWQGGTQVQAQSFGGRAVYQPAPGGAQSIFARGQVVAGPTAGRPVAGPQSVRVTAQSLTPTRTYQAPTQLPQQVITRSVYRAPLPSNVPHMQSLPQTGQHFVTHSGPVTRLPTPRTGNNGRTPLTGTGRTNDGAVGAQPTGSGRINDGGVGARPTGIGRTNEGTGSRTPTSPANPPRANSNGSSGLDAYLKERGVRNSGAGRTGADTGSTPSTGNGKDNTPPRSRVDTIPADPRRTRANGDNTTQPNVDTTRRTGDTVPPTDPRRTRANSDNTAPPKVDTTRRTGDPTPSSNPPRSNTTSGTDSRTTPPRRSNTNDYRPLHNGTPPTDSGKGSSSKSDPGKSPRPNSDPKPKDTKDNKDTSKDHKNP